MSEIADVWKTFKRVALVLLPAACAATLLPAQPAPSRWWAPGANGSLPAYGDYANAWGRLGIVNASGPVATAGHPFFEPIGSNGRACVSCHQPADGMSLAVTSDRAALAGHPGARIRSSPRSTAANCPHLPARDAAPRIRCCSNAACSASRCRWPPRRCAGGRRSARVHHRSRARSDRLQHAPGLRHRRRAPRGVGVPPAAAGGQSALRPVDAVRRDPVHRQDRHARGRRSRDGPAGQHEHDGRCARADAQDAGAVGRARRIWRSHGRWRRRSSTASSGFELQIYAAQAFSHGGRRARRTRRPVRARTRGAWPPATTACSATTRRDS